jgi:membrane-associated phospholipid phosphatase
MRDPVQVVGHTDFKLQRPVIMPIPRVLLIFAIVLTCAVLPALAQETQEEQSVQATQDPQQPAPDAQPVQDLPEKPKENPATPESHGSRLEWENLPGNILKRDQPAIWMSPFHINRQNAKWWILFGGGTAALISVDKAFNRNLPNSSINSSAATWASRLGADYTLYPLTAAFYLYGKPADNPRARDTARIGIEALANAEIVVNVLKTVTQRPRPDTQATNISFFKGGDAFPSGHSIQTMALARVIALEFHETKWAPILTYGLASVVPIARVAGRRHSMSDAFAGSAMGFFIGDFVYRHHHAPSQGSNANAVAWIANHVNLSFAP